MVFDFAGDSTMTRFLAIFSYKYVNWIFYSDLECINVDKNCKSENFYLDDILILDLMTGIELYRRGTDIFTLQTSS